MDLAGTAVGIASLGIQICQGLLTYYDEWQGYHEELDRTYAGISDLAKTFTLLRSSLADSTTNDENATRVEVSLRACEEGLLRLQARLYKLRSFRVPQGMNHRTWAELQRLWYPFRAKTITKLRESVGELRSNLSLALQVSQQITLNRNLDGVRDGLSSLLNEQQATKRREIMDWLSPPDPESSHDSARRKREPGTGTWLLANDVYRRWKASDKNMVVWLTGKAGSGKTILCSTVVEDMREGNRPPLYFYFSFSDAQKLSFSQFLSSLVAQLLDEETVFDSTKQAHAQSRSRRPSVEALENILAAYLQSGIQSVLILDALDELAESSDDGRTAVLDWLRRTIQSNCALKVFMTSRQTLQIEAFTSLLGARCVLLRPDLANNDIERYVAVELERHPKLKVFSPDLKQEVQNVFREKCDGMFRWAFCQLEVLKGLKSTRHRHVKDALYSLPLTLDATYEQMLLRIGDEYHEEALNALRWLTFETRPLKLHELSTAYLIDYQDENLEGMKDQGSLGDVIEILTGLIIVEAASNKSLFRPRTTTAHRNRLPPNASSTSTAIEPQSVVRLAHFSVKEYLLSDRIRSGRAAKFALTEARDRPILAQSCLTYLNYYARSPRESYRKDVKRFPLLYYAAEAWTELISKRDPMPPFGEVQLLRCDEYRNAWLSIFRVDYRWFRRPWHREGFSSMRAYTVGSAIYYASYLGLLPTVKILLEQITDVNAEHPGIAGHALQAASKQGHLEVVKLLIDGGANVNTNGGEHGSALHAAASKGHRAIVELLIERGADVNSRGGLTEPELCTALDHGQQDIVSLLSAEASKASTTETRLPEKTLQDLMQRGRRGVVEFFLDRADDRGYSDVMDAMNFLLSNGMTDGARELGIKTPLQTAAEYGDIETVKILLDNGAEIEAKAGPECNVLHVAASSGRRDIVELLLQRGANVNAQGDISGSTLQAAAVSCLNGPIISSGSIVRDSTTNCLEIMRLLLDYGADIGTESAGFHGGPLQVASRAGHQDVVAFLLDRGLDINTGGGVYGNALHCAFAFQQPALFSMLLDRGADVNAMVEGQTLLQYALRRHNKYVVVELLRRGADVGNIPGGRALQAASEAGGYDTVDQLMRWSNGFPPVPLQRQLRLQQKWKILQKEVKEGGPVDEAQMKPQVRRSSPCRRRMSA